MNGRLRSVARAAAALLLAATVTPPVSAAWVPTLEGAWLVSIDVPDPVGVLSLHQGNTASPSDCARLTGQYELENGGGTVAVNGSYCPASGRLVLAVGDGVATQVWTAQAGTVAAPRLTGTAAVVGGAADKLAEYPIVVWKP